MSRLELLFGDLPHRWKRGTDDRVVAGVTHDSRQVVPGGVFVAVRGRRADGLRFADEATRRGAAAIVVGEGRGADPELATAERVIEVPDEREALAVLARNLNGRVDERLTMVGVTGTNGKTTTCAVLTGALEASGRKVGLLGTVSYRLGDKEIPGTLTTPEATEIHGYLARMSAAGCEACVMEVSSIALDLKRVHGIVYAAAVFTNLTGDHLDYHGDMQSYFAAKSSLFEGLGPSATAVINIDDPHGRKLASRWEDDVSGRRPGLTTFGLRSEASIRIETIDTQSEGTRIDLREGDRVEALESPLVGRPNAYNVVAAAAAARSLGVMWEDIRRGVAATGPVPGRLEPVAIDASAGVSQGFRVYVDYAHTDDALATLLETVRDVTKGRVTVVFGCGGDRDRSKRPRMGACAERLADRVVVTSDNPRGEPPMAIIDEILSGMQRPDAPEVTVEPDRAVAIDMAIRSARAGDTVVIAGKGHETYQICGMEVRPFDDRKIARDAIERALRG